MKPDLELKPGRLLVEEREGSMEDFLGLAGQYREHAWLMAESPREFVFGQFTGELAGRLQKEAVSLTVFGPAAEVRFERAYGDASGWLRLTSADDSGAECLVRSVGALLRDGSGRRLVMEEYYRPDESGFLMKFCGRLSGVEAS